MDVDRFLAILSDGRVPLDGVSLALVGYQLSDADIRTRLDRLGLNVQAVTTDLHVAAKWRNSPAEHQLIVALAMGRHPGVSTLAHFPVATARDLARDLLSWAQAPEAKLAATQRQKDLLEALSQSRDLEPLVSLSGIAAFLSAWSEGEDELDAPRRALPRLGLLPDRNLFTLKRSLAERLTSNFALARRLTSMPGSQLDAIRRRSRKDANATRRAGKLDLLSRVDVLRRVGDANAFGAIEYEDAMDLVRPPPEPDAPPPSTDAPPGDPGEPITRNRDPRGVSHDGGGALIDGDQDRLNAITDAVSAAIGEAIEQEQEAATGSYEIAGEETGFELPIDRSFLTWVRAFCSDDVTGGWYRTDAGSLEEALEDYRQADPILFKPIEASIAHEDSHYSLHELLNQMQSALLRQGEAGFDGVALWAEIVTLRTRVLQSLDLLIQQPLLAVAGRPVLLAEIKALVGAWERFYSKLSASHEAMMEIDPAWTRALLEAVAAIDVVQIETRLDAERRAWKAILLPTHPLHLWRYERMAHLASGLKLTGNDRQAVLAVLERPEHFLGVLYLSSFPEGRGGNRPLPVARDYRGLAVFENFKNAYSGLDGVEALQKCLRQFALIYANHTRPMRLALLNPPEASRLLAGLLDVLKPPRGADVVLSVDIYATPDHRARLQDARRFSTADRDLIEDHIRSGRLRLRVHDELLPLEERLATFKTSPVHILAVFDEASTEMRRAPGGANLLPMSPFALRRRIEFRGIAKRVELQLSLEESVFRSFYDMISKLEGKQTGRTPQAFADAERMKGHIEVALTGDQPGAFWFFFADRAVPSAAGIHAARILERTGRQRRAVCYDASYDRLAYLLRAPLESFNLRFPIDELGRLLEEGVSLVGDGLIDLLKPDGQPDVARVRGLAGALIAARDYRRRHPDSLLVSVDGELARLWLRLTPRGERCDLIGLRADGDQLILETIEVKTSGASEPLISNDEIDKARQQILKTLDAVKSGLQEDSEAPDRAPLAAPRQEMLKEVFVAGCQSVTAGPNDRERWADWLKALFVEEGAGMVAQLRGLVYAVELTNNSPTIDTTAEHGGYDVMVRRLRETRIQDLISPRPPTGGNGGGGAEAPGQPETPGGANDIVADAVIAREPSARATPRPVAETVQQHARTAASEADRFGIRFPVGESLGAAAPQTFYLNPSNTKLNQLNIGIVGDLGTGKTQLTKALIYQLTRAVDANRGQRPKVLIFDYKRDYTKEDFVTAVGARVVKPYRIPLNIFDLGQPGEASMPAKLGRVKFLNDVLHRIWGGIGMKQRNQLKQAVLQAYENVWGGWPTLDNVFLQYQAIVGDKIDAPYSILSDLTDLEIFVPTAGDAQPFDRFFDGVVVIDLAELGVGEKERNMVVAMFLNLYFEYMQRLEKRPYEGTNPQLRFVDSMLLVDEADNIMKFNFDVLRQILLQGREFGVGVILASQYLSHFRTKETDYTEPLLSWFVHKVPNVSTRELEAIGLSQVSAATVDRVKALDVHHCLFKTLDVPGRFIRGLPFYEVAKDNL